ncbi:piggyBac transposable element-derived protein 4-like [Spea bombifrons]|uniref:piggyBac transposable element-derived protein 4-like n=1 Tax=Spea bombifrons TaxID=233779 RepID=UPI00234AFE30|nr:piggyBac transposable element-derived protein 4-like [Spea bombifrons]
MQRYTAEEAYAFLATDSEATDTASDFDVGQFTDTSSDVSVAVRTPPTRSRGSAPEAWVAPNRYKPAIPPFSGIPGINIDVTGFTPLQFVQVFLGDDVLGDIVTQTNIYAQQHRAASPNSFWAKQPWTPIDVPEFLKFWALTMLMGIIKKPSIRSYWSTSPIFSTPIFAQTITRQRYEMILRFMHFSDNSLCPPKEDPQFDRLYKIRPLITHLAARFPEVYTPGKNICVDESLMKYKGRLGFKQYIPSKRSRYGVKVYKLCESETGYTHAFRVYEGKDSYLDPPGCPDHLGTSAKIVWDLIFPLMNKGYHLYVDNFYTSVPLFKLLYCFDTVACGSIKKNRLGFPQRLVRTRLGKGETSALRQEELLALKFKDRKEVCMLSTIHDERTVEVSVRGRAGVTRKPVCIRAYNKHMGGVDLSDQLLQPYLIMRKTKAWYKKVAIYLMQIATYNAFLLHKKADTGLKLSFLQFQLEVISGILYRDAPGPQVVMGTNRIGATHFIFKIPPTAKKQNPQKRCRVCYSRGQRKDTTFYCPDCPGKPALCVGDCFKLYHTVSHF